MDGYTALSNDSFDDFIVSGNYQESRTVKLRFKILEFIPSYAPSHVQTFDQKLSNSLRCAEGEVGRLF